jgi:hypothetical protein
LEPIEIPSDEDMVAKFMRDKIQGGNKWATKETLSKIESIGTLKAN